MISEKERKVLEREDEKISLRGKIGKGITFTDEDFEEFKRLEDLNKQGKLWDKIIIRELDKKHKGDIPAKEVIFLCAIGRLVKNKKPYSFNALILAPSSSGKDHLVASVLKLFPKRDLEIFGRISAKALNYLHTTDIEENYSYNGKMIYLKEIEEEILNNEVMKEFTSGEEELSKVAITKQKGAGVDVKEIRGHPEVFSTTATTIPTEEIRNRFNILGLDVSDEQTELSFLDEEQEYSEIIKKFIASLEQRNIKIPRELFLFMKKVFPKNKVGIGEIFKNC